MAPLIRQAVTGGRAGLLLVSLGLIDLGFYTNAGQTAANVRRFVAEARAANPAIRMALMPVVPNVRAATDPPFAAECERFNELLTEAVTALSTPASPILLVPPPQDWRLDRDTHDGTRPSPSGEHRLAAAFADALRTAWGIGAPYGAVPEPTAAPEAATVPAPTVPEPLTETGATDRLTAVPG